MNGIPNLLKWKIYETLGDKVFECKIYVCFYIFEAFDILRFITLCLHHILL
jgi:hypothetical protein